jgi:PucR C-terminal helix-turn-helix domain/GGDEF-like domain
VEHPVPDSVDAQVAVLGARMLERADDLADEMAEQIRAAAAIYRNEEVITAAELRRTCLENIDFVFGPMGHAPALASPESRANGRRRAQAGIPLTSVMEAYRVCARFLWERLAELAATGEVPTEAALRAASQMWLVLDTFTQEMADGYREEATSQALNREAERSAIVQALLEGRLDDAEVWQAADSLRLPIQGPYVVVAAQVPEVGRHALARVQDVLRPLGVASAWRLLHDAEVGIAQLPGARPRIDHLADTLAAATEGRVGISPVYHDLRRTADALKLARIALRGACDGQRVTVFDRDPLAITAASAPQVMHTVAHTILGSLDQIPQPDRTLLLDTFGAWLDADGSADRAAAALFCHPNTVRHRLRRLQEHTGRSLSAPRQLAELTLAFEIDRRITNPTH